ncbi:hypothetical protein CO057_03180 [Candidatus Uhrbacteria bacterium CG_4_9_14_0_2_um_filter_41_50]|uniref:Cation-transporting P-type ATPase N-terminal domain-containing protein n=1 Tax=Candidatus Uhrbacteria bacterium CG_4_9_14_0_2_um_filter_41_50 TaxID=1975031 RepID=A0A2M8ENH1_9BACT|nr:MAG: hypothetical protein COZ45_03690 [Candidatus Uhrbacteria bacterium CG_4_10_14_3_um_filter_41_21]PIZ54983.1 MAG: hypothetical protein COY24_02070 [Candidatus Uhrbacteria bacterium CG_4_10_14_0_2_um_filter_41_21]PJB84348.1 MAG: hypothetical protein CO086_04070 [Candidatus Uhrbacteria bacterium CG_4_9_14_0_8_um_filter_41_16]PJC24302.1 MAG: hypothetical protein CO057_03180 [Candidatus Uhrbacteria bacterium CG_4_9_14_0_2_um_filter_41_50]PJE75335.1 MAG: hypothetical protein COV03_01025 [Candi
MNNQKQITWHAQSAKDVLHSFEVLQTGLSENQVRDRLKEFGKNQLPQTSPKSTVAIFLAQFGSPLIAILVVAAFISVGFKEWLDAGVISFAVLINAVLGFVEEYKADRSLRKLQSFLPDKAKVRRGGAVLNIDSINIVPGDIIILGTGDKITADGRIISSSFLQVNEAALTGESMSVKKDVVPVDIGASIADQTSMVFAGTVVVNGRAEVITVESGERTQIGQISRLVADVEDEKTPLQQQLAVFALWLGGAVLIISSIVFVAGLLRGFAFFDMFKISIAISVSAIPEGLIVATTVILAIGMQRILKKKALVRRLVAAETLGSVSVICMDKTGTLTTGEMSVTEIRFTNGELLESNQRSEIRQILGVTSAALVDENGENPVFSGSPTEIALAKEYWPDREKIGIEKYAELSELPFDPAFKFKAGVYKQNGSTVMFVVGAPDILLEKSDLSDQQRKKMQSVFEEMTERGLRVLLIAKKDLNGQQTEITYDGITDISVVGFVGLQDPLRSNARHTVETAGEAGLKPVMITGDHVITATLVAREVGLLIDESGIMTGLELDKMSDADLIAHIDKINVFARVLPSHKLRIVRAWQDSGASVAMVGDGVNDAPAMKAADIGVALGSGTEVTKEIADMVLLDNNFQTIVEAIREDRTIFDNIRKMIVYLLSDSFSEVVLIFGAIILSLPIPILPAQILWINLITDGFPSVALTFEPPEKGVMKDPPRNKKAPLLDAEMKVLIFIIGLFTDALLFGIYFYLLGQDLAIHHIRTFIFVALGINSLIYIFAVRKFRSSIFRSNPFENLYLIAGVGIGFVFLFIPLVVPYFRNLFEFEALSVTEWLVLLTLALFQLVLIEIVKEIFNLKRNRQLGEYQIKVL